MHWATSFLASSQFGVQASLFRNSSKLRSAKTEDLRHWHGFPSQAAGRSQSFRTIAFREAGPGNCQQSLPCTGHVFEMRRRSTEQPRQSQRTTGAPTTTPSIGPGTGPPTCKNPYHLSISLRQDFANLQNSLSLSISVHVPESHDMPGSMRSAKAGELPPAKCR